MAYELQALDTCLSDYFSGYHKPVMAIPVYGGMPGPEFVEAIVTEYHMMWDHLCYDNAWPEVTDKQIKMLAQAMLTDPDTKDVFPGLDPLPTDPDDEAWEHSVYCYIACVEV